MRPCSVNMRPCSVNMRPCSVNMRPCSVNMWTCSVNTWPCSVNMWPCSVDMRPCSVNMRPGSVDMRPCSVDMRHLSDSDGEQPSNTVGPSDPRRMLSVSSGRYRSRFSNYCFFGKGLSEFMGPLPNCTVLIVEVHSLFGVWFCGRVFALSRFSKHSLTRLPQTVLYL